MSDHGVETLASESLPEKSVTVLPRHSGFFFDVLKLVSGTTIAQVLGVLVSPILTRLFAPDAFGVLALFTSITLIFTVIACLRYELAIMLPQEDEEAANLLALSVLLAVGVSIVITLLMRAGGKALLSFLKAESLFPYLGWVSLSVFVTGIFMAQNYWNSRTRHFGRLSIARVISSVGTIGVNLVAGLTGFNHGGGLIGGTVAGQALAAITLGGQIWRDDREIFARAIRWPVIRQMVIRYRRFPLYSTWAALLNVISWQLPIFMLSYFFSTTVVGYYSLGFRILQLPMSLIGASIAQVFFQRASEAKILGNLAEVVENTFRWLVRIGLFPMLMLGIMGRDIYTVVFGETWAEAGVYTQILSLWAFFWFIASPMSTLFSVLEKQDFDLKINLVLLVGRFLTLGIGGMMHNARLALALFAALGVFVYGYWSFAGLRVAGIKSARIGLIYFESIKAFAFYVMVMAGMYILSLPFMIKAAWLFVSLVAYGFKYSIFAKTT